jgi:hypothetical protein
MQRFLKGVPMGTALLIMLIGTALAGETGHYVSGVEGIKAASVPGPGVYYKIYNVFYQADTLNNDNGDELDVDFDVTVFASAHRFIWVTPVKILGADFLIDTTIPLIYTDIEIGAAGISDNAFGLGDLCVEPFALSWHGSQYDAAFGLAGYVPIGQYDEDDPASPGKDFWTAMITLGGTYYLDEQKTWSASILGRYEIHSEKASSDVTPGNDFHFEWGLGKTLAKLWDVGAAGYCHWQVTDDTGSDVTWDKSVHDRVYAIGPEISTFFPSWMIGISLKHLWEFDATDRSEGYATVLNITKVF